MVNDRTVDYIRTHTLHRHTLVPRTNQYGCCINEDEETELVFLALAGRADLLDRLIRTGSDGRDPAGRPLMTQAPRFEPGSGPSPYQVLCDLINADPCINYVEFLDRVIPQVATQFGLRFEATITDVSGLFGQLPVSTGILCHLMVRYGLLTYREMLNVLQCEI